MKSISFKYSEGLNLTQAVIDGYKTMTRIEVPEKVKRDAAVYACDKRVMAEYIYLLSPYRIGDMVAIQGTTRHIRITDVRVERLQDITNTDCMREGIIKVIPKAKNADFAFIPFYMVKALPFVSSHVYLRAAFASLANKTYGIGAWDSNPLVYVYRFELVD